MIRAAVAVALIAAIALAALAMRVGRGATRDLLVALSVAIAILATVLGWVVF